ncbi:MAG: substrate-binding domain-containing protein [Kiritimatiellae bacterium]|nr:substrate-binding domain-containing protein [Kiritimatiellia bacterium]
MLGTKARKLLPEKVGERIFSHIRKRGLWGQRLPSQRDLADQLGVSLETAHKGISYLRQAGIIVSVPRQGSYVVNHPVETLATASRAKMLLVVDRSRDPRRSQIFREIYSPLDRFAAERGLDTVVAPLDEGADQTSFTTTYPPVPGDVLVFLRIIRGFDRIKRVLRTFQSPAVLLDHFEPTLGIPGICDDGFAAMQQVARHLVQAGHRRIAYLDYADPAHNPWKRDGYQSVIKEAGLAEDPSRIVPVPSKREAVDRAVREMMQRPSPPSAILAVDDGRAVSAIHTLRELHLRPGHDIAVTGHGDSAFADGEYTELTSVRLDWAKLGELAAAHLSGESSLPAEHVTTVPGELIVRASSKAVTRR